MGYSVSDAVAEVLKEMQYLNPAFKQGLVNYSAVARLIQPLVSQRMGVEEVGLDAVIVAIRRFVLSLREQKDYPHILRSILSCKQVVHTGMVCVHLKRSEDVYHKIIDMQQRVNWLSGEKMYVIQRSDEISVITQRRFLDELHKIGGQQMLEEKPNLALLTIYWSLPQGGGVPGTLALLSQELASVGVNIVIVFSSFSSVSFLIEESDAGTAYNKLNNMFQQAGKLEKQRESNAPARQNDLG
ncbi:MAG: hypothetical protein V1834_03420 [Candidatus Micrarchaeota archaeon]